MDEGEFLRQSDACLKRVAKALEELDPDELDYVEGDGVVTIEFATGAKFILSRQSATKQIWLAADSGGSHYNWDAGRAAWIDDKDGYELMSRLVGLISEKLGHPIEL